MRRSPSAGHELVGRTQDSRPVSAFQRTYNERKAEEEEFRAGCDAAAEEERGRYLLWNVRRVPQMDAEVRHAQSVPRCLLHQKHPPGDGLLLHHRRGNLHGTPFQVRLQLHWLVPSIKSKSFLVHFWSIKSNQIKKHFGQFLVNFWSIFGQFLVHVWSIYG